MRTSIYSGAAFFIAIFVGGCGTGHDGAGGGLSDGGGGASMGPGGASGTGGASGAGGTTGVGGATGTGGAAGSGGVTGTGGAAGSGGVTGTGGSSGDPGTKICGGIVIPKGSGGPSGGPVGTWANVTPGAVTLVSSAFGGDNFGAQDVLVDPVRPSDFYAFFCHQGVWRSTDYGQTWTKVNTGTRGAAIDGGKPWGEGIDSNRCRDPETPPTLYSLGSQGSFWRSNDGGVNWASYQLPNDGKARPQDGYDVDVDPYDGKHLIVGFHEESGMAESNDGGTTWHSVAMAAGMAGGISWYGFFIDTGDPATTGKTWLFIAQANGTNDGTWRTTDAGASWTKVDSNEHPHGGTQIFQSGGVVYMAGVYSAYGWGVLRSTDFASTFTHVGSGASQNTVYGTPKYVYAQSAGASGGTIDQTQSELAPQPGTTWSTWALTMGNGPKRAAVSYDGTNYIIVGGNWTAGLWRYVEP